MTAMKYNEFPELSNLQATEFTRALPDWLGRPLGNELFSPTHAQKCLFIGDEHGTHLSYN